MNWQEHYRSRTMPAEQAAAMVKPGMRVSFPLATGGVIQRALAARADKIGGAVDVRLSAPVFDPGWLANDMRATFRIEFELFIGNMGRPVHDRQGASYLPNLFSTAFKATDERPGEAKQLDMTFVNVTPPNEHGFVSFGPHQWNKRSHARRAHIKVAEVDANLTRTYGDVWMHVNDFDYFVEGTMPPPDPATIERMLSELDPEKREGVRKIIVEEGLETILPILNYLKRMNLDDIHSLLGLAEPSDAFKAIAGYLGEVLEDGATIQIGQGNPSGLMPRLGAFDRKHDLGLHTEMVAPGIAKLVDAGIMNGRRKTIHRGKAVAVAWSGSSPDDLKIINDNPAFELYDPEHVLNIGTLMGNHKQTSINNALSIDLTGQIDAESVIGARMMNGNGGQPEMHMGAFLCPGGRAITLLPSTAMHGAVSRVVAQHEAGTLVTVPRFFADTVITEYGIARLLGKNHRERAAELIAVAHPDHRGDLRKEAARLFG